MIEPFSTEQMVKTFKANERAGTFRKSFLNDFDVCSIVDHDIVKMYGCNSVYALSDSQKQEVRRLLVFELHIPEHQAVRCIPIGM